MMLSHEERELFSRCLRYVHSMRGLVGSIVSTMRRLAKRMSREQWERAREEWSAMEAASDSPLGFDWLGPFATAGGAA